MEPAHPLHEAWAEVGSHPRPVAKSLHSGEGFNLVAFAFGEGMELKDHAAKWPSRLTVLRGAVVYSEARRTVNLSALETVDIPAGVVHWVLALEKSLCLLSQAKPKPDPTAHGEPA
ncbi:MAG: hypothetical protein SFY70_10845 [Bacteroidia bacterium]|nr:hypothetical protein [Bacteroidia bacterium]